MLGLNGAIAFGLPPTYGWKIAALAAVAAVLPDWDGLPMLIDMAAYERGHRVWGHNLLACAVGALTLASIDYRYDLSGRVAKRLTRMGPLRELRENATLRERWTLAEWGVWVLVAWVAGLTQIPADAMVSGGNGLSDWALQPLWPFSSWEFVYPLVPWGNVGVTIVFAMGMLAMVKWNQHLQGIACVTLAMVAVYLVAWGSLVV